MTDRIERFRAEGSRAAFLRRRDPVWVPISRMAAIQLRVLILGSCAERYAQDVGYNMAPEVGLIRLRLTPSGADLPVSLSRCTRLEPQGSNPEGLALPRLANDKAVGS